MIPRRAAADRSVIDPPDVLTHPRPPPWRLLPGFDQFLATWSEPAAFMTALVTMLSTMPGISGAWIGRPNDDELLVPEAVSTPDMPVLRDRYRMIDLRPATNLQSPAGRAWRSGRAELCRDIRQDLTLRPWRADWEKHGLRAGVSIPLTGADGPHRLLSLYSAEPDFFHTHWSGQQLSEFGAIIGNAIEARLRQHALQRSKRLLDILLTGLETLLEADCAEAALHMICARLSETGPFAVAAIGTVDAQGVFGYRIAAGVDAARVCRLRQSLKDDSDQQLLGARA